MSMYEIDTLLENSIEVCQNLELEKKNIIWNLEQIPNRLCLDAGCFEMSETDKNFNYSEISIFKLITVVMSAADEAKKYHLIYDWSAFVLNFYEHIKQSQNLEQKDIKEALLPIKTIFKQHNFDNYAPTHASLTIYQNGNDDWFGDEQNEIIQWYVA